LKGACRAYTALARTVDASAREYAGNPPAFCDMGCDATRPRQAGSQSVANGHGRTGELITADKLND
jgi:hypothetical protein